MKTIQILAVLLLVISVLLVTLTTERSKEIPEPPTNLESVTATKLAYNTQEVEPQKESIVLDETPFVELESKKQKTEILKKRSLDAHSQKMQEQGVATLADNPHQAQKLEEFYLLILQKSWAEVIAKYSELDPSLPIDESLMRFVFREAPVDVIKMMIEGGASMTDDAIQNLLARDVQDIEQLINYGLDIHALYDGSRNGLAAFSDTNPEVFDYLLLNGVSLRPVEGALDPLDYALMNINTRAKAIGSHSFSRSQIKPFYGHFFYFVNRLMEHGAEVGQSHRELLRAIKDASPDTYGYLVEQNPGLSG